MTSRDTRREENQKLFRTGNERLHDLVESHVNDSTPVPFLCECAAEHCDGRVEVQLAEWKPSRHGQTTTSWSQATRAAKASK